MQGLATDEADTDPVLDPAPFAPKTTVKSVAFEVFRLLCPKGEGASKSVAGTLLWMLYRRQTSLLAARVNLPFCLSLLMYQTGLAGEISPFIIPSLARKLTQPCSCRSESGRRSGLAGVRRPLSLM